MTTITESSGRPAPFRITGWHVLIATVLFFGVVIAVDTLFIVTAYRTFSGQVASNPYEAGLAFNRTLAERQRQSALGWSAQVDGADGRAVIIRMVDAEGQPLDGLSVVGVLERPATEAGRQVLSFTPLGRGRYRANARLDGAWDLSATARSPKASFSLEARLVSP